MNSDRVGTTYDVNTWPLIAHLDTQHQSFTLKFVCPFVKPFGHKSAKDFLSVLMYIQYIVVLSPFKNRTNFCHKVCIFVLI